MYLKCINTKMLKNKMQLEYLTTVYNNRKSGVVKVV